MSTLKKWFVRPIAALNVIVVLLMVVTGYSGYVNPVNHPLWAVSGLAFPLFMVLNASFLIVWLLLHRRYLLIPLLGFIVCLFPVRTYIPINFHQDTPEGAIKVVSFNVHLFEGWKFRYKQMNPTVKYLKTCDADIVCLQEAGLNEVRNEKLDQKMAVVYPYHERISYRGNALAIYSKWPILATERIKYTSAGNLSTASRVLVQGDTVLVVNNHLETYGLSYQDKDDVGEILIGKGKVRDTTFLSKMENASRLRAPQADAVSAYIRRSGLKSVIVCGDFNDHPLSYAHHTIGRGLTDCYETAGCGPGFSYDRNRMYVRIDHIFCSKDWRCYDCYVDRKVQLSDHYPIICTLKKRSNR